LPTKKDWLSDGKPAGVICHISCHYFNGI